MAVTLYALLELYKQGEATWTQDEPFAEITVQALRIPDRLRAVPDPAPATPLTGPQRLTA